jgi:capsular exopolysaccharide synthesis family protein
MDKFSKALALAEKDSTVRRPQGRQAQLSFATSAPPTGQLAEFPDELQTVEQVLDRPRPGPGEEPAVEVLDGLEGHLVSLLTPTSFEAEQYRALRYMVEHINKNTGLRVLGVTSPAVGDGKTVTAINLAGTLSQAPEVRVLLVEADLRKPGIATLLGLAPVRGPGLVDAILDPTISLDDVVRPRPPFRLSLLPGGPPQLSPYEMLRSPRLTELFEEMRQRYDYVVLDTPPLILFPDCRLLQPYIDGLLMIVAAHKTPRKLVEDALNIVDRSKILGLVFNGDDRPRLGYYDYSLYSQPPDKHRQGLFKRVLARVIGSR